MRILSIETSCDETAVSMVEASGNTENIKFKVLGDTILSQIDMHREFGGVFPTVAKREHARHLIPSIEKVLKESNVVSGIKYKELGKEKKTKIEEILKREPELLARFKDFIESIENPNLDAIVVTSGPGLEPALWIGINVAQALSLAWKVQIVPVNHMEGHIISSLLENETIKQMSFPALALLISGGHTELVLIKDWLSYEVIGRTRDDAVGEAFDKVARMLGLSYPGGPEISKLAHQARVHNKQLKERLPRPMLDSDTYDFSFSGLKTAVLYMVKNISNINEETRQKIAREFEDAVTEVLISKTMRAVEEYNIKTLIIGGGVSANTEIRRIFEEETHRLKNIELLLPDKNLSTDNAIMIAAAGYLHLLLEKDKASATEIKADGNLSL
ncbi:tRNA (adenosine(37)-N6)-threonylcarbamoyltransferase complex transferase subunit TsaD [Patescibacteria group bacterium]|nr:tRNA (adenosine(37)-N6)-threonylcarbamoyltransferase complex transferase subunit TsaD [Patescibacteria group bacterium]